MEKQLKPTNYGAVSTLTTVFFFWGFFAAGNGIFIPFCKNYFSLDQFQSQLIDFAFYGAYYIGALGLFLIGTSKGKDIVGSMGYKKSIVYGLLFSALGAVAMIISVYSNVFAGMLFGLFIVALGFSLQQTSANPFMISLGDERTGSNRISLGGGVNSFGTFIGPIIVSLALFGSAAAVSDEMIKSLSLTKVIILYAVVGCLFLGVAALFGFSKKVPDGKIDENAVSGSQINNTDLLDSKIETATATDKSKKAVVVLLVITGLLVACFAPVFNSYRSDEAKQLNELSSDYDAVLLDEQGVKMINPTAEQMATAAALEEQIAVIKKPLDQKRMIWLSGGLLVIVGGLLFANVRGSKQKTGWGAMQYPQLTLGMLAIFVYVGVEVAIGSNLGEFLKQKNGLSASQVTPYVAMFWGSLMIGRWIDAVNAFSLKNNTRYFLQFILPLAAFGIIIGVLTVSGYDASPLYWYFVCVLMQIAAYFFTRNNPVSALILFGILGVVAMVVGCTASGTVAVYALLSGGLFCSIMWSCIFSLSLAGLGKYQAQGSAFLVMMILGGAIIPPLQGKLSDIIGIQPSFAIGAICFAYITFFAVYTNALLKRKGVSIEESGAAH